MNKKFLALAGVALLAISAVAAPPGAVRLFHHQCLYNDIAAAGMVLD